MSECYTEVEKTKLKYEFLVRTFIVIHDNGSKLLHNYWQGWVMRTKIY